MSKGKGTNSNKSKQIQTICSNNGQHSTDTVDRTTEWALLLGTVGSDRSSRERRSSRGMWFWSQDLLQLGNLEQRCSPKFTMFSFFFWEMFKKSSKRCPPEFRLFRLEKPFTLKLWCFLSLCDVYCFHNFHMFFRFSLRSQEGNSLRWLEEALWSRSHLPWPDPPWWGLQAKWIRIEGQGVGRVGQGDHGANCSDLLPHEQCLFR